MIPYLCEVIVHEPISRFIIEKVKGGNKPVSNPEWDENGPEHQTKPLEYRFVSFSAVPDGTTVIVIGQDGRLREFELDWVEIQHLKNVKPVKR